MVFPKENFEGNSKGEDYCWGQMRRFLPQNYVSFHNYSIDTQEVDWILLVPDFGVLVVEIKGFNPNSILYAIDNTNILMTNGTTERSPYLQCKRYWKKINEKVVTECDGLNGVYIAKAICYPYFSLEDIKSKKLNRLCDEKLIICREDLASYAAFSGKISSIFIATYEVNIPGAFHYGFTEDLRVKFADFVSPSCLEENEEDATESIDTDIYSHLIVTNSKVSDDTINELVNEWKHGTKIFFFTSIRDDSNRLKEIINTYLSDIEAGGLIDDRGVIFNCSVEYSPKITEEYEIVNGDEISFYKDKLEQLGRFVAFNTEQYLVEHSKEKDIIVRAGAGTGKTYLLVSRIAFLCWKNDYSAFDLLNKLILITFTNDATDEMKSRLEKYYSNLFLLTYNKRYFKYVEEIENMRISTIDSLSLSIIKKYAYYLGLGKDLAATNATVIKKDCVHEHILEKLNEGAELPLTSYEMENILLKAIEKIENKNIDLNVEADRYFNEKNGENDKFWPYFSLIPDAFKQIERKCEDKGRIITGHIIIYLRRIVKMMEEGIIPPEENLSVDYVFIDEFQDTDDVQIELVSNFKRVIDFDLFVVGDVKQSIYRFRGAIDDKAFRTLEDKLGYRLMTYPLKKNYRTNSRLLDYMDSVFKKMSNTKNLLKYSEEDELIGVNNPNVPAEVVPCIMSNEEEREAIIVSVINEFVNNADKKDNMGILVRRRSEILKIRDICAKHDIRNVDIDVGGQLYKYDSSIDLYKLVIALQNPYNASILYNLYTTSFVDESLNKAELTDKDDLVEYFYLNPPKKLSKWKEYLESLRTEPILKVIREIVDETEPWEVYRFRMGDDSDEAEICGNRYRNNLEKLFEKIAIDFNGDYLTINSLADFLSIMITTEQEEEERSTESDFRIECRTVHRAKGKEYSYVFLPFSDDPINIVTTNNSPSEYQSVDYIINPDGFGYHINSKNRDGVSILVENSFYKKTKSVEEEDKSYEEARILYVAVTRAKKRITFVKNASLKRSRIVRWQDVLEVSRNNGK